jgi:phosphatidylglycerophosphatase A
MLLTITIVLLGPAVWASTRTSRLLNKNDPGLVVIDEVLGVWVTMLGAKVFLWKSFFAGFVFFRVFDIWKPWPIRSLEKLPEGIGIVADDLVAGIYAALILYIGGTFRLY